MKAIIFLIGSAVFASFLSSGVALDCYECASLEHTACEDEFEEDRAEAAGFSKTCPEPTEPGYRALCRKTHQTILGKVRIIRGCGYANNSDVCTGTRNTEVIMESCQCFTDNCNSAGMATLAPMLVAMAFAMRAIY